MTLPAPPVAGFWRTRRLPLLLQTEAAECGLACLAMVACHWGLVSDLSTLRRRFEISQKGVTLAHLVAMAQSLGLEARPLKLELSHLPELALPCILHWDMNHFVVLRTVRRRHVLVHDPATGVRRLPIDQVSRHFTGVALELRPGAAFRPAQARQRFTLPSLMGRVIGLRRGLAQLLVLGVALQVCLLVAPFYLQWIVDEALVSGDRDLVTVLGLGFLGLVGLQAAIGAVRSWITSALATRLGFQWFGNVFAHLMRLPLAWFEKRHLGDIVSRFGAIQTLQRSLTAQFVEAVIDGLLVLATGAVMVLYSPTLAAVAFGAVLLYALLRGVLLAPARHASAEQIVHAARQQTHFLESARGVQSLRLFGRVEERRIGWLNLLAEQFNAELRIARLTLTHQTAHTLLFGVERVAVVWLAALAVLDQRFSVGMLFAFMSYKDQFSQRTAVLVDRLFEWHMLRLHGERLADIVLADAEPQPAGLQAEAPALEADIALRGVTFRYADGEPPVLQGLDLTIPAGQCIAITGASGSGKTTLVKIVLGLLQPTEGEVRIGGVRLDAHGVAQARRLIGTVMQEDALFVGSLADNISFFDPSASTARIEACARLASIHDDIVAMPMGYHTLVGDVGSGLSGGQRQRVLLARALYRRPRILVLDEATSHLDVGHEQQVNRAVRAIAMTRVIVAHRPQTIGMAERVVVLDRGRIVRDVVQAEAGAVAGAAFARPPTSGGAAAPAEGHPRA